MKRKVLTYFLIAISFIMITISITTLSLESGVGTGDWAEVCCGEKCGSAWYCMYEGSYNCCF